MHITHTACARTTPHIPHGRAHVTPYLPTHHITHNIHTIPLTQTTPRKHYTHTTHTHTHTHMQLHPHPPYYTRTPYLGAPAYGTTYPHPTYKRLSLSYAGTNYVIVIAFANYFAIYTVVIVRPTSTGCNKMRGCYVIHNRLCRPVMM
jgi:hypothetical protein